MISFLKKLAEGIVKGAAIATGLEPFATGLFPKQAEKISKGVSDWEQVAQIVTNVEVIGSVLGAPGADKLKAATPLVAQVLIQSDLIKSRKIKDQLLFRNGAQKIADGMADVLNSLDEADAG